MMQHRLLALAGALSVCVIAAAIVQDGDLSDIEDYDSDSMVFEGVNPLEHIPKSEQPEILTLHKQTPAEKGDALGGNTYWKPNSDMWKDDKEDLTGYEDDEGLLSDWTFHKMLQKYPFGQDEDVKVVIGGQVNSETVTNLLPVRVSMALYYAGRPELQIEEDGTETLRGKDGKYYYWRAKPLVAFLTKVLGKPSMFWMNPDDPHEMKTPDAWPSPKEFDHKKGIVLFDLPKNFWDAGEGRIDLIHGGVCATSCYFGEAKSAHLWEVAPLPIDESVDFAKIYNDDPGNLDHIDEDIEPHADDVFAPMVDPLDARLHQEYQ